MKTKYRVVKYFDLFDSVYYYRVEFRRFFIWFNSYYFTDFFTSRYESKEDALAAIEDYKNRITEVE